MEDREYIELRAEEVQEILGTPPSWLVRWGSVVIFFCLAVMVGVSALVRYPDVVSARIEITTAIRPVDVVAQTDGYLEKLFVKDNERVAQNAVLGLLQSTTKYDDILQLERLLKRWQQLPSDSLVVLEPPRGLFLGDLQAEYAALLQQIDKVKYGKKSQQESSLRNESAGSAQISRLQQAIANDKRSMIRLQGQLITAKELYQAQKSLYNDGIISRMALESEKAKVAAVERELEQLEDAVFQKENQIIALQKNIGDVQYTVSEQQAGNSGALVAYINALQGSIARWKQAYLLIAPIAGNASLNSNFFAERQFVKNGEVVLTLVPPSSDTLFGRMSLPIGGSGKVEANQRVIIKLDNYPYHEYGTVEGEVLSKSLVPRDNAYRVQVLLKKGLRSSYGRDLTFQQQLQGNAEIVTDEKSFLRRITDQVFSGRKRNALGKD